MPKCEDCELPVVWLRKPDGGWLPPVEPIIDFAFNDHFIATLEGVAQQMPQVYRKHVCLTWEERQLKRYERESEKQQLIREDRERRAEEARIQLELAEAREAERRRAEEQRLEDERAVRLARQEEAELRRRKAQRKQFERDLKIQYARAAQNFAQRLLPVECDDCGAESGEACRELRCYGNIDASPYAWWKRAACNARYAAGPPDDRSELRITERWGEDYDEQTGQGTTPWTVGPWPPSITDAGRYDMRYWLKANYLYVFTPEKAWLTSEEETTLTDWLADFGGIFEEVQSNGTGRVAEEDAESGPEGVRGRDAEGAGDPQVEGDRVDPDEQARPSPGDGEQADRGEGTQWLRKMVGK